MHQIRFPLGLRPSPDPLGSLQRSPDTLAAYEGLLLREGEGREAKQGESQRGGEGREKGRRGIVTPGPPPIHISGYATGLSESLPQPLCQRS